MEVLLRECANYVALAAELCSVLCIAVGMVETLVQGARVTVGRSGSSRQARRDLWAQFARWIVLALEFALAADIVRTAIAPTWDDIGRLAAIAFIRTGLNYFLERDMEEFAPAAEGPEEGRVKDERPRS
ncbi:hypothetical protein ASD21_19900 [Caulobacter sp. Root1455]|uniref:DUF1622 domain-containing protein n=1 Tax=unclassified Caulobacter TaxID=2648921 RepID=UPI000700D468|nr:MULTISPECIES: DUF1622 domain-containing protein [unclassified Caulobacter]KQY26133.1 hypothetical protein ASD38_20535 [Caulobacter sp. Root487D2Y]KQZ04069.1 hypothetical protein ASD21_19900 [Caulobacter sp. Root1455]